MLTKTKYTLFNKFLRSSKNLLLKNDYLVKDVTCSLILEKIYNNFDCIELLITDKYYEQGRIILRSNIEKMLLYLYILCFPDKKEEYELNCDLLKFKNKFIHLKDFTELDEEVVTAPVAMQFGMEKNELLKRLQTRLENYFNSELKEKNREKLLKELHIQQFVLSEQTYKNLNHYFSYKFRFPQFEKIYTELTENKKFISNVEIRQMFYSSYNEYSQITHTSISSKNPSNYEDILELSFRVNNIILFFSKEQLGISLAPILTDLKINQKNIEEIMKHKRS